MLDGVRKNWHSLTQYRRLLALEKTTPHRIFQKERLLVAEFGKFCRESIAIENHKLILCVFAP